MVKEYAPGMSVTLGGAPTAPDVKRLDDKYGVPEEDALLTWDELAAVVGMHKDDDKDGIAKTRGSFRFRTIINTWRRKLRQKHNVITIAVSGQGIMAATPSERIKLSNTKYKSGMRSVAKSGVIAETTDRERLTEAEKVVADFHSKISGILRLSAATEAKKLPKGK